MAGKSRRNSTGHLNRIDRRGFLRLLTGAAATLGLSACGNVIGLGPSVDKEPGGPQATPVRILANENRADRNVRYFSAFPAPDPAQWSLKIEGLVQKPQQWSFAQMQELPYVSNVSRMKCVECWSWKAEWGGFTMQALADRVKPDPEARFVRFNCMDGYWEVLSIEELREPGVIFTYKMDGKVLPAEYGSPLRAIVPSKYGYKGAKAIERLTFEKDPGGGYWSTYGYSIDGTIQPGYDHPQDLPGGARAIPGGQVVYADDRN